ncbi:MAG: hypothetical protein ACUVRD_06790 [Bacteroidia bacterium]
MKFLRVSLGVLIMGVSTLYFFSGVYDFFPSQPFSGKLWYNPFEGWDTLRHLKANFHIHSRSWGGLTNGHYSVEAIEHVYDSLGYDVWGISDYQKINPRSPIKVYEHGYSVGKVHQLLFESAGVSWWDFPLWQSIHDRQHILKLLRPTSPLIVLAHPSYRESYPAKQLKKLSGYDAIEVLNRYGDSVAHWDSALSAGRYAPILSHDNTHNPYNPFQTAMRWTEIGSSETTPQAILRAIYRGATVGYLDDYGTQAQTPLHLEKWVFHRDTMEIHFTAQADSIRLVGQGGKVVCRATQTRTLTYLPTAEDTYVRAEAYLGKTTLFTSPCVRSQQGLRPVLPVPPQNRVLTWAYRLFWLGVAFWGYRVFRR